MKSSPVLCKSRMPSHILTIADYPRSLPPVSISALTRALLNQLPQDSSPMVMVVKPEQGSPNGNKTMTTSSYDPRVVYILELAAMLAIKDENSIASVGKDVAEALQNVIRGSATSHPVIVSRAVFYLLHLLNVSHVSSHPEL